MRKFLQVILLLTAAGSGVCLTSCSLKSCFDETESRVKAGFYSKQTGAAHPPDSLTLYGMNLDTNKIYNQKHAPKQAEFPLFAADTSEKFIIMINDTIDTIAFHYRSYIHLISKECGYTYFFDLDTVIHTANIIDSLAVVKNTITTASEENIRIYY